MKAMGNFTVDFNWVAGKCQNVRIVSNAGAELKVRCTRGAMDIEKASIKVNGSEVAVTVDANNIATIPCEKDDVVEINFTQVTSINGVATNNVANNGNMYDLNGRRVSTTNAGQVYIQNGVKKLSK